MSPTAAWTAFAISQCSEPFYRSTVLDQIATDPKAGVEEKRNMMEMLRRFEQSQVEGDDAFAQLEDEEVEEEDELRARLDGLDLDALDSNTLFHLLPQAHRDKFLAAMRNPESGEAKELLEEATKDDGEGTAGALPGVLPWWEASDVPDERDEGRYAEPPGIIEDEAMRGIKPPPGTGTKLAYNAIAISLAYLHTLLSFRLPSLSPSHLVDQHISPDEVKSDFAHLVPFLVEPRSTVRHGSARDAWGEVWERMGEELDHQPPQTELLIRLVKSLPPLLHPPILASEDPKVMLVLSDLYGLFAKPKQGQVAKKLVFYFAALKGMKRDDWLRLEKEVQKEVAELDDETTMEKEAVDPPTLLN